MRPKHEIYRLIRCVAENDERIRAVLLNGSRANTLIQQDVFQDYDIVYVVNQLNSFRNDPGWINVFGERIIMQMPHTMQLDEDQYEINEYQLTYLMLFSDTNRIDLTLIPIDNINNNNESLTMVLLDKDGLFSEITSSSDIDYLVRRPSQKQYSDCCNEFWWISTYVMKGLMRKEIIYAKEMLENPLRKMFMRMLSWSVGIENDFTVNLGKGHRFLKKYLDRSNWERVLITYPDACEMNIRRSFKEMISIFHEKEIEVAKNLGFEFDSNQSNNVMAYLYSLGL